MEVELKKRWVNALRSGDFKQGTGVLKARVDAESEEYVHCCLGVLGELIG